MHCPKCGLELQTIPFKGVQIDQCFHCGGVFLDNGELEKLAGTESHFWDSVLSLFKA
ncbi:MAG: zf-TFIIB domain-containing protein [Deltaproteobacteria bacterium]|nr:zf-TFIIB domain-containing protein [Deltaproteobacteria bacterium]